MAPRDDLQTEVERRRKMLVAAASYGSREREEGLLDLFLLPGELEAREAEDEAAAREWFNWLEAGEAGSDR